MRTHLVRQGAQKRKIRGRSGPNALAAELSDVDSKAGARALAYTNNSTTLAREQQRGSLEPHQALAD
jgi:hypothetical protein